MWHCPGLTLLFPGGHGLVELPLDPGFGPDSKKHGVLEKWEVFSEDLMRSAMQVNTESSGCGTSHSPLGFSLPLSV